MKRFPLIVIVLIIGVVVIFFIRGSQSREEIRNTDSVADAFDLTQESPVLQTQTIIEVSESGQIESVQEGSVIFDSPPSTEVSGARPVQTAPSVPPLRPSEPEVLPELVSDPTATQDLVVGEIIVGEQSPLIEFNLADYQRALASDKLVMLYFYASWCPSCKVEFSSTQKAFDDLPRDDVIGFRLHYNDSSETKVEKDIAKQYGVTYQHTKVLIKSGEVLLITPQTWNKQRYLDEINKLAV